jgi:hypothetical protein
MEEIISQQLHTTVKLYNEKLLPVFFRRITEHHKAMSKIETLQKQRIGKNFEKEDKELVVRILNDYKNELEIVVSNYFSSFQEDKDVLYSDYFSGLDAHLETVEITIKRTQDNERFFGADADSKTLKFRKTLKRYLFNVSKIPLKTANIFRKTKKEVVFWQQEIPFKNVTEYYFKSELTHNLRVVSDAIFKEISEITNGYWEVDKKIDDAIEVFLADDVTLIFSDELLLRLNEIPSAKTRIENQQIKFNEIYETSVLKYRTALYKADTIELSADFFNTNKITNYQKSVVEKSLKDENLWLNTFRVLESDWELDLEIFKIIFNVLFKYDELESTIDKRTDNINKEIAHIKKYINDVKATITAAKTKAAVKTTLVNELKNLSKSFKKIIEKTTNSITSQELPLQINQFEESALHILQTLSKKKSN